MSGAVSSAAGATDAAARIDARKSYAIPALEILGFEFLLNEFDRHALGDDFASNASTIRRNLHASWVVDSDPFRINQLGHPYAGAMYQGFARSAGLNYWESLGYTFAGSALWEIAGERTLPSRNDQINTGIGGSFLGEILFRLANLTLEHENLPPFWRETAAALISPPVGFNRLAFGPRFRTLFPSNDAVYVSRLEVGVSRRIQNSAGLSGAEEKPNEALVDYSIDYGLPGKPGYTYSRPFDYFSGGGHDNIVRLYASLTWRVFKRHGVSLRYLLNRRDAFYPDVGDSSQMRGTFGLYYTYIGHDRFGFVDY